MLKILGGPHVRSGARMVPSASCGNLSGFLPSVPPASNRAEVFDGATDSDGKIYEHPPPDVQERAALCHLKIASTPPVFADNRKSAMKIVSIVPPCFSTNKGNHPNEKTASTQPF